MIVDLEEKVKDSIENRRSQNVSPSPLSRYTPEPGISGISISIYIYIYKL